MLLIDHRFGWMLLATISVLSTGARLHAGGEGPVSLIFDTDVCGDCDDVLALGMIHAMESRGHCRLLAVTVSADNELAAPFVDAVNRFYGRDGIPIGVVGGGGVRAQSKYLKIVATRDGDRQRFPHALLSGRDAPNAVDLLRKTLSQQPDGSVVIAQVGFSTNLARLLESKSDANSPLDGTELVRKKVKLLSLMAGAFQPIDGNPFYREYNVVQDVPAAKAVAARWPTPMVWSGFEIGVALPYPSVSIERDYGYVPHHPLAEAYIAHEPPPHNRPTWDLTSVLYAVHPDRGYFDLSTGGTVAVRDDGSTRFVPKPGGTHRYLILKAERRPRILEALVQLSSQPPSHPDRSKP